MAPLLEAGIAVVSLPSSQRARESERKLPERKQQKQQKQQQQQEQQQRTKSNKQNKEKLEQPFPSPLPIHFFLF